MGSTVDGDSSVFSSGRLAYGCTNLATAWPHGGTGLGLVGQITLIPQRRWAVVDQEETNSAVEVQWLGGTVVVGLTCEGWDDDAMNVLMGNASQSSGQTVVEWPGSDYTAGVPISALTNVVFTPRDTTNGRAFVLYRAVPVPDVNAEFHFNAGKFLEVPAVLIGVNDGTGTNVGKFGRFSDLGALP